MKIISGFLKGRTILKYNIEGTRPTMDRIKESLFAIINKEIVGSKVLDLFSGTGNLGIEAISNGAKICYFNDNNKKAINTINDLVNNFNIKGNSIVLNKDYNECLSYLKNIKEKFNIIFLDPPYNDFVLNDVIKKIIKYDLLLDNGIIVCEVSNNYLNDYLELDITNKKKYGDKQIIIYTKKH